MFANADSQMKLQLQRHSLGIDLGASSVKLAMINVQDEIIYWDYALNRGEPLELIKTLLKKMARDCFVIPDYTMCSGVGVSHLENLVEADTVSEMVAILEGSLLLDHKTASVISIGGHSAGFLTGFKRDRKMLQFAMNDQCAAGTGSFFEDQMQRLGLPLDSYTALADQAQSIPRIAGRCSVFAKTDMIHRQQEGVPVADILKGLSYALVKNYKNNVIKNQRIEKPVMLAGGIAKNKGVVMAIRDVLELKNEELIISPFASIVQALGTAKMAMKTQRKLVLDKLKVAAGPQGLILKPLESIKIDRQDQKNQVIEEDTSLFLGIDIGSTSTNLVLINDKGQVVDALYLRTAGNPEKAVEQGMALIKARFSGSLNRVRIGTTGSGRYMIGRKLNADLIRDEITAQSQAALYLNPEIDTIFEIGGQDSKFIACQHGRVTDFQMNRVCAAGTGSFLEEQASRLGIELNNFGALALSADQPIDLGDRCTVFMETNIATAVSRGIKKNNIAAGLCYAIVNNYLNKVVGNKKIGEQIALQGGVAYNDGIVAAFKQRFPGKVTVTPYFHVTGALGMALLTMKNAKRKEVNPVLSVESAMTEIDENRAFIHEANHDFSTGARKTLDPLKKTVGIPRALMIYKLFPLVNEFFISLGYNVFLTDETDEKTIALAQAYTKEETCYPIKLLFGHIAQLVDKKVDYIFMPSILTIAHSNTQIKNNYGCVFMQTAPQLAAAAVQLNDKGIILLSPVLSMNMGKPHMLKVMLELGKKLGKNKAQCMAALAKGGLALTRFTEAAEKKGKELLKGIDKDEKVFVLVTRNYGVSDPILNMGIADAFLDRGYKVITLAHLEGHSIDLSGEYQNLYWPFSQHILSGAQIIKNNPNLYAVYLTNHGCGPDGMIAHLFSETMGDKPYLSIEVDEHYSPVGLITRVEAFISSLEGNKEWDGRENKKRFVRITSNSDKVDRNKRLVLPNFYPYSPIFQAFLEKLGFVTVLMPQTSPITLKKGEEKSMAKEYSPFNALLGDVLSFAEQNCQDSQFMLFQTHGAETDGFYHQVIAKKLEQIKSKSVVVACYLEELWQDRVFSEPFFKALLLGDYIMAHPSSEREQLLNSCVNTIKTQSMGWEQGMSSIIKPMLNHQKPDFLVGGEAMVLYNNQLNQGIPEWLEKRDFCLAYMPLSEYFLFMWMDQYPGEPILVEYQKQMRGLAEKLGSNGGFASEFKALRVKADEKLPVFAGGNGRYRLAKKCLGHETAEAHLLLDPAYENTGVVLRQLAGCASLPILHLSLDGHGTDDEYTKLKSFLYFIKAERA